MVFEGVLEAACGLKEHLVHVDKVNTWQSVVVRHLGSCSMSCFLRSHNRWIPFDSRYNEPG